MLQALKIFGCMTAQPRSTARPADRLQTMPALSRALLFMPSGRR